MRRRTLLGLSLLALGGCSKNTRKESRRAIPPPRTRLVAGGDVMLSRWIGRLSRLKKDPAWPFRQIASTLSGADIAFLNLEAPFSDRGPRRDEGMIFRSEPEMVEGLTLAGVDVVSTANNHARDCGRYGVEYTLKLLQENSIRAVGTGVDREAPHNGVVLVRNGSRFGFLAYTYDQRNGNWPEDDDRIAMMDPKAVRADVRSLRRQADAVVVSMHAGLEYSTKPDDRQKEFARTAIDAGAALVVGHHPHVVQPVEEYGGGIIFYSLGNLVFDQYHRAETQRGAVADVEFSGASPQRYRLLPVTVGRAGTRITNMEIAWKAPERGLPAESPAS